MELILPFKTKIWDSKFAYLIFLSCFHFSCNPIVEIQTISNIVGPANICMLGTNLEYSLALELGAEDYVLWTVPDQAQIISGQGKSKIKVNFGRKDGSVCAQLFTKGEMASEVQCFDVTFGVSGQWCRDVDMQDDVKRINQMSFVINNKAYIVMGASGSTDFSNDVWMFDPATHEWVKKAPFPGPFRIGGCGFSLNNKGYIACGENALSGPGQVFFNDLWEYNPETDLWIEKDTLPGSVRQYPFVFTINNKAYIGNGKSGPSGLLADFYEYDPTTSNWTQKANTPFFKVGAATFSINNEGYVCAGSGVSDQNSASLFKYSPINDSWQELEQLPASIRKHAIGFSIENKGYVCGGENGDQSFNDLWEFDNLSGQWVALSPIDEKRSYHNAFTINNKGYILGGKTLNSQFLNDMWVYTP